MDKDALQSLIDRVTSREGLELVHWELIGPPNRAVLKIFIDKPGGVTHGDCENISMQIGVILDVEDLIPSSYTLEVSSPGVERGLYKAADYLRFTGNRIRIKTGDPINGRRNFRGILSALEVDTVILEDETGGRMEIPLDLVAKANLVYEFK